MLGDIDPIKAARSGLQLGDDLTMHYGLLPRANRGIFAINELPDLAGKIQVGLFNILQEGDVQIKGYPVRLRLDVMMAFTANPEDYTARGKIITPLKDRIGSEIRTHYAATRHQAMAITAQEAWTDRPSPAGTVQVPPYVREVVEEIAFQARAERRIDKRSGVSQRLPITAIENVASNAERRAIINREAPVAGMVDVHAALPSITGKFELEYEGELRGADNLARDLIRAAVANVFIGYFENADVRSVVEWFDARWRAAARRQRAVGPPARGRAPGARPAGAGAHRWRGSQGAGTCARLGRDIHPRGAVRYQEDQPQRRSGLPRGRNRRTQAAACGGRAELRRRAADAGREEEVLQLTDIAPAPGSRLQASRPSGASQPRYGPTGLEPGARSLQPMRFKYTKFIPGDLDDLDLESLVSKLSDLLLSSGFNDPYFTGSEDERSMQALYDAILEALMSGGVLPDEMMERLLGENAGEDAQQRLEELIQQIMQRLQQEGYISPAPDLEPERRRREQPGGAGSGEATPTRFEVTDKSIDFLGYRALRDLLGSVGRSSFGRHDTQGPGNRRRNLRRVQTVRMG